MKKRLLLGTLVLAFMSLSLTSCGYAPDNVSITDSDYTLEDCSNDYTLSNNKMTISKIDDGIIEYVSVDYFLNSLNGFLNSSYLNRILNAYNGTATYFWYTKISEDSSKIITERIVVDYNKNTITLSNFFAAGFELSRGGDSFDDIIFETQDVDMGDPVVYNLSDYDFDIYFKNQTVYIPFVVANAIFCSSNQENLYLDNENQKVYFVDYDLKSSNVSEITYSNEQTEEFREYNLNSFEFIMDNFYGLKNYKNIGSFDEYISDYKEDLLSTDPVRNLSAYRSILLTNINEMHTRIGSVSYYLSDKTNDNWDVTYRGEKRNQYKELNENLVALRTAKISSDTYYESVYSKVVEDSGKKYAYLIFDEFSDGIAAKIESKFSDEYDYIIIDLSLNVGGYSDELYRILGLMTDEPIVTQSRYMLSNAKTESIFGTKTNKSGDYKHDAYDSKYYVIASECSFSCGNIMPAICGEYNIATVIGNKTCGGMCAVFPYVLADGTSLQISSTVAQYANDKPLEDGYDIDDKYKIEYDNYFDVNYIINFIKGLES